MPTAMLTFNGRITLPSQVRRKLGLKIGDKVEFVENEKGQFALAAGPGSDLHLEDMADFANQAADDPVFEEAMA